jgi:beta-1,4-N-acetylglucosaminyltransferase
MTADAGGNARVCFVASSGGHLLQLVHLAEALDRSDRDELWVSFETRDAVSLLRNKPCVWAFAPTNRSLVNLIRNFRLAFRVLRHFRATAVVSTGAGIGVPFIYAARLLGITTIFIESFSRITEPSLTARLVRPVATHVFVQWPELQDLLPGSQYEGAIF